jgi:iron complex transport system permease protein
MRSNAGFARLHAALAVLTLVFAAFSLTVGQFPLTLSQVADALAAMTPEGSPANQVIWSVRLPRVLTALFAGGALGLAGASLQGVFRNPLVDPHIIGVTSGAAFGGTLAIVLGLSTPAMLCSTFAFGLTALALVYGVAKMQGRESRLALILSGIILSGFFSALVSLMQYMSDTEEVLPNIVFWLMGSFATADWQKLAMLAVFVIAAGAVIIALRWRINLLALDDADAKALGVNPGPLRLAVLLSCAVLVAAQVAVSGSIGWVGLVIPHISRMLCGADHRRLLPTAFWVGSIFMIAVDDLARTLTQAEIPIGIITALLGAPIFAAMLIRARRRGTPL